MQKNALFRLGCQGALLRSIGSCRQSRVDDGLTGSYSGPEVRLGETCCVFRAFVRTSPRTPFLTDFQFAYNPAVGGPFGEARSQFTKPFVLDAIVTCDIVTDQPSGMSHLVACHEQLHRCLSWTRTGEKGSSLVPRHAWEWERNAARAALRAGIPERVIDDHVLPVFYQRSRRTPTVRDRGRIRNS